VKKGNENSSEVNSTHVTNETTALAQWKDEQNNSEWNNDLDLSLIFCFNIC